LDRGSIPLGSTKDENTDILIIGVLFLLFSQLSAYFYNICFVFIIRILSVIPATRDCFCPFGNRFGHKFTHKIGQGCSTPVHNSRQHHADFCHAISVMPKLMLPHLFCFR